MQASMRQPVTAPNRDLLSTVLNRVPEVTLVFWVIKILATTVGETAADFLSVTLNLGLNVTSYLMVGLLVAALVNQFRLRRYVPASYWTVVVLISIVGTLLTDNLVDNLGISLVTTTVAFSAALAALFGVWYASEKTLAMKSIDTPRRELFYWAAILLTFAFGTAAGDLLAEGLGLGYGASALIYGGAIAAIAVLRYGLKLNAILAFWVAYILTRPLGASVGDLLSQNVVNGGLGLGTVGTSAIFLTVILGLVGFLSFRSKAQAPALEPLQP